jgi:hypothetical protein
MLLATLRKRGVELWMDAGRLRYRVPIGILTVEDKAALAAMKEDMLCLLSQASSTNNQTTSDTRGSVISAAQQEPFSLRAVPLPISDERQTIQPDTQIIPYRAATPGACYACGTMRRWRSIYGAIVCARCHPPGDAALVAAWEGEA